MERIRQIVFLMLVAVLLVGCGKQNSTHKTPEADKSKDSELTSFQIEHGIGPITEPIELDNKLDPELIKKGQQMFKLKCSACHKFDSRYVGPPLGGITDVRTPAYIMNMILNPQEMIEKHPIPKALLGEYYTQMTNQNLSEEEARAVVEYLAAEGKIDSTN